MKKVLILLLLCLLLTSCSNAEIKHQEKMTYEEMHLSENYIISLGPETLKFDVNLEDLQEEAQEIEIIKNKGCQIIVKATCVDEKTYDLYFDCIEHASETHYQLYSMCAYIEQWGQNQPPHNIHVTYRTENKELSTELKYFTYDLENEPNVTYRIELTDDLITKLGTDENINIHVEVRDYYFEQATK